MLCFRLRWALQSGVLDRVKVRWFGTSSARCADAEAVFRPLTLADLLAVLAIAPLAAAGCCLLLVAELAVSRLLRRGGALWCHRTAPSHAAPPASADRRQRAASAPPAPATPPDKTRQLTPLRQLMGGRKL